MEVTENKQKTFVVEKTQNYVTAKCRYHLNH